MAGIHLLDFLCEIRDHKKNQTAPSNFTSLQLKLQNTYEQTVNGIDSFMKSYENLWFDCIIDNISDNTILVSKIINKDRTDFDDSYLQFFAYPISITYHESKQKERLHFNRKNQVRLYARPASCAEDKTNIYGIALELVKIEKLGHWGHIYIENFSRNMKLHLNGKFLQEIPYAKIRNQRSFDGTVGSDHEFHMWLFDSGKYEFSMSGKSLFTRHHQNRNILIDNDGMRIHWKIQPERSKLLR